MALPLDTEAEVAELVFHITAGAVQVQTADIEKRLKEQLFKRLQLASTHADNQILRLEMLMEAACLRGKEWVLRRTGLMHGRLNRLERASGTHAADLSAMAPEVHRLMALGARVEAVRARARVPPMSSYAH